MLAIPSKVSDDKLDWSTSLHRYLTRTYSPAVADQFYAARPLLVAQRLASLAYLTSSFTAGVLWDWLVLGKLLKDEEYTALKRAEPRRAKEGYP